MVKYLYTLVSIRKKLDIPFRAGKEDKIKRFVAGLQPHYARVFIFPHYIRAIGSESVLFVLWFKCINREENKYGT